MVSSRRTKLVSIAVLSSLPVMLFFQNCGQQGSIGLTGANSKISTGMVIDTAGLIPVDPNDSSNTVNTDHNNYSHGGYNYSSDRDGDDKDCDNQHGEPVQVSLKCHDVVVSDVLLSVQAVSSEALANSQVSASFEVLDQKPSLSIDHNILKLKALKPMKLKDIFIQLNSVGNKILSLDNVSVDLKTPSSLNSGLKVHLNQEILVEADKNYVLKVSIVPEDQVVTNASMCIFKPVIKEASLSAE